MTKQKQNSFLHKYYLQVLYILDSEFHRLAFFEPSPYGAYHIRLNPINTT